MNLSFTVYGTPRPQGSMRVVMPRYARFARLTSDNKHLKPWRQEIGDTLQTLPDRPSEPSSLPVWIVLDFYFTRPRSAKNRRGMTVKPDLDKLCRAVFDAIRGIVYVDDAQVIDAHIRKHYGDVGTQERVVVTVGDF